jgi:hypothetical protein
MYMINRRNVTACTHTVDFLKVIIARVIEHRVERDDAQRAIEHARLEAAKPQEVRHLVVWNPRIPLRDE